MSMLKKMKPEPLKGKKKEYFDAKDIKAIVYDHWGQWELDGHWDYIGNPGKRGEYDST